MKGRIERFCVAGRACMVYLAPGCAENGRADPCLYANAGGDMDALMEQIAAITEKTCPPFALACPLEVQWDREYSPWAAEIAPDRRFAGGANAYLRWLTDVFLPEVERRYAVGSRPMERAVLGYSLGGLAALYAFLQTRCFGHAASLSGSLWYPGWREYAEVHISGLPIEQAGTVYLSLGKAEAKTRSRMMAQNAAFTQQTHALFAHALGENRAQLVWNNGGHSFEVPQRFARAIEALLQGMAKSTGERERDADLRTGACQD